MKNWLTSNAKLKRSGIYSWGIPACKAADGSLTCPMAKDCIQGCYARNGFYVMPSVRKAQEERLELSKHSALFVSTMVAEIKRRKIAVVRVHDSGDFYSKAYALSWMLIAEHCPETRFYAYTKMVPLFKFLLKDMLPGNFTVIFSYGGKADSKIDPTTDRHSAVFPDKASMLAAGYADTTTHDHNAFGPNHRVGLVYHGAASKAWEAGAT